MASSCNRQFWELGARIGSSQRRAIHAAVLGPLPARWLRSSAAGWPVGWRTLPGVREFEFKSPPVRTVPSNVEKRLSTLLIIMCRAGVIGVGPGLISGGVQHILAGFSMSRLDRRPVTWRNRRFPDFGATT